MHLPLTVSPCSRPGLLAMVILMISAGITYLRFNQIRSTQWTVRWTACLFLGGLAAYNYAALGLPGSQSCIEENGFSAIIVMLFIGMGLGLLAAWFWEKRSFKNTKKLIRRSKSYPFYLYLPSVAISPSNINPAVSQTKILSGGVVNASM